MTVYRKGMLSYESQMWDNLYDSFADFLRFCPLKEKNSYLISSWSHFPSDLCPCAYLALILHLCSSQEEPFLDNLSFKKTVENWSGHFKLKFSFLQIFEVHCENLLLYPVQRKEQWLGDSNLTILITFSNFPVCKHSLVQLLKCENVWMLACWFHKMIFLVCDKLYD